MNSGYGFALLAMLFWGLAPLLGKMGLGPGVSPLAALTLRSVVVSLLLLAVVTFQGQWAALGQIPMRNMLLLALEGLLAALLGQLAYYYALKLDEVGRVTPVAAAFPLVAMLLGILLFGEELTVSKVGGAVLIVAGVALLKN